MKKVSTELTKAEEQIMKILWEIESGFVKNIIEKMPEPKPAYNTVSTIVRILEKKGFVSHESYGKTHKYFPVVSKESYKKGFFKQFLTGYFEDSYKQLVSFFAKEEEISVKEMEDIKKLIDNELKKRK